MCFVLLVDCTDNCVISVQGDDAVEVLQRMSYLSQEGL